MEIPGNSLEGFLFVFPYWAKKSAIEDGINYVSYFMGLMALDARARLKVNEIVPRVGLHGILIR